jgi:hypothetical protein
MGLQLEQKQDDDEATHYRQNCQSFPEVLAHCRSAALRDSLRRKEFIFEA